MKRTFVKTYKSNDVTEINISVRDPQTNKEVYHGPAYCVDGKEGVFAVFPDPHNEHCVSFATGDDGFWNITHTYDRYWLPKIIWAIQMAARKTVT